MFVKDAEKGVNPKGFEEYADGSIFAEFHIMNDEVWNAIKDGTYKGFSLAGCFTVEETFKEEIDFNKDNDDWTEIGLLCAKIMKRISKQNL